MSFLGRLFGGESPGRPDLDALAPGDRVSADGEEWTVRAIVHYRMEDNEWPSVQLERGDRSAWIAYEEDALVRYEPVPDLHLAKDGTIAWRGRVYTVEDAGTATVSRVTGAVDVAPGDRVRYHTLTSPDDTLGWLTVESWDSGYTSRSPPDARGRSTWSAARAERKGKTWRRSGTTRCRSAGSCASCCWPRWRASAT